MSKFWLNQMTWKLYLDDSSESKLDDDIQTIIKFYSLPMIVLNQVLDGLWAARCTLALLLPHPGE